MKKNKNLMLSLLLAVSGGAGFAQNGLEGVIVEKYYVSNAADATGSIGALPAGSVTYRVYADMLPGYNFQALYGVAGHTLKVNTSTSFFNNEDRGSTNPSINTTYMNDNSVALDSWFSVGGAANGELGVPKSEDNGATNLITGDPILLNADPAAGIPLTTQDGMMAGSPVSVTFVGLNTTDLSMFDATSNAGNSFSTSNGSVAALGGSVGPIPTSNKVLVGQFTTNGSLHFELNIQIGTPSGGTENYVASNPGTGEISIPSLIYTSAPAVASTSVSYCVGVTSTALVATPAAGCTLNWYTVPTGGTATSIAPMPATGIAGTFTYYVSQSTASGDESARTAISVTVNPNPATPSIIASGVTTFCSGNSVDLTSSVTTGNLWSTTATTASITVTATGTYTVTETDVNGCQATSAPTTVTVNPTPVAAATVGSTVGSTVTFSNTSTGATSYSWDFGDASAPSTATNPTYTYSVNGNYTVTLVATNGTCTDTTTLTTDIATGIAEAQVAGNVTLYPNPASDNITVALNVTKASDVIVTIYDVTGKVVATPLNEKANQGSVNYKLNVSELPAGLYFANIKANDAVKTIRFTVTK